MGFFDTFKDIWKDPFGTWKNVEDSFTRAGSDYWGAGSSLVSGLWNTILAITPYANQNFDERGKQAINGYLDFTKQMGSGTLNALSGITQVPILNQTFQTLDTAQNELVRRPIGTLNLVGGDYMQGRLLGDNAPKGQINLFDRDVWRQAYDDTRRVSAGQAMMYGGAGAVLSDVGRMATGQGVKLFTNPDPRTPQGQAYYHDDPTGKWGSGSLDMLTVIAADPTVGALKLGKLGKLRFLSKPMSAAAISRGEVSGYISSNRATKVFDFTRHAPNEDVVHQTVFNGVPDGGVAAKVLFSAAKTEDPDEARRLFDATMRHLAGDPTAKYEIAKTAPRLARDLGDMADGGVGAQAAKEYGTGNAAADAITNARRETDTKAFLDEITNGEGLWARANGLLLDQYQPRMSFTSQWRVGAHRWANGNATFFGAPVNRVARPFLPTSNFTRLVNFEDPGPTEVEKIRSNWEGARALMPDELATHVQNYATATTAQDRFYAFAQGENAIFKAIATKYGFSEQAAEDAIRAINSLRATTRSAFSQSRRYMSTEAAKLAQQLWDANAFDESARVRQLGDDITAAADNPDVPESVLHLNDEDKNVVLIPEKFKVAGSPISPTQTADYSMAMDWRLLHQALWWEQRGPVGSKAYKVLDQGRSLLDAASSVWKVAQLLRPGYTWRMLSDENARALAVMGAGPTFSAAVNGLSNLTQNLYRRGRLVYEDQLMRLAYGPPSGMDTVKNARVVEQGAIHTDLAEARPALEDVEVPDRRTRTWPEVAVAVRKRFERNPDLVSPEIRSIMEAHAVSATDPISDLAAHLETAGVPKGINQDVKVTKRERKVTQTYTTLGKALSDGVIPPDDYVQAARSAYENRPNSVTHDMAAIFRKHKDAGTDPSRELVEHALWLNGRDAFTKADWRQGLLDELPKSRLAIVDPFSGMSPEQTPKLTGLARTTRIHPLNELDDLENYVHDNIDELMKPNSMLHAQVMKDGFIELAVAKVGPDDITKPTGGRRIKFGAGSFDYKQTGAGGVRISLPDGQEMSIAHAFDGASGARLQAQVSSAGEAGLGWADRVVNKEYRDFMTKTRNIWRDITAGEQHYAPSWERVVNTQLGNDAVARQILSGRSDDDIVAWMRKTADGQRYLKALGPWQSRYWVQVASLRKIVDLYVPKLADGTEASEALRKAVLARNATFEEHLKPVVPNIDEMPTIHGTAIEAAIPSGQVTKLINGIVEKTFRAIGDIPADRFARFPFAADRYSRHTEALKDAYLAQYQRAGYDTISTDVIDRIQQQAQRRTVADVKKYLYDAASQHDLARMSRLVVPFGSAIADSYSKWGIIARERPWVPYNLWKVWTSPERGGHTTDDQGNHKRYVDGQWRWVSFDPVNNKETVLPNTYKPQQEYVSLQLASDLLPNWLAGEVDGVKFAPTVNKEAFNTFLSLPTAGPIVAVPANAFSLSHPEFAENKFVKTFVLPFGPQGSSASMFVPGYVKGAFDAAKSFMGEDGNLASTQAVAIWQTEMVRYGKGERPEPPTIAEVRDKAARLKGLRFLYQLSGLSPQFRSPYQPYIDYYRQLRAQDPMNADAIFYETAGQEFFPLTMSVTRNQSSIPATIKGYKGWKQYEDLINQFPDLAGLIIGKDGAGSFSSAVYQWQLNQALQPGSDDKMRKRLNLQESIQDVNVNEGWLKYSKMMALVDAELLNRGLTSINQKGAQDLKDAKGKLVDSIKYWTSPNGVKTVSPWFVDYSTRDSSLVTARLTGMSQIVNDTRLRQRDDMLGLTDYLQNRQQMKDMMDAEGFATLNSKKAAGLRSMWDSYLMSLRDQNQSFAQLYDRWLSHDEFLDASL